MAEAAPERRDDAAVRRARSVRTALALASIAFVFFLGVLFSREAGGISVVFSTAGFVLMVVLLALVGINLRR
jgi:hypothetical protein